MKALRYLTLLIAPMMFASMAHAQVFYNNTGTQNIANAFETIDEIADDTPFTGTQHVASFTFKYANQNPAAVNATVRFYGVDPSTGGFGDLVATIPVTNLAPGGPQFATVNLTTAQQFDWTAEPGIFHLSNVSGGFVSFQFDAPDRTAGWYEAGGVSLDGFYDVTLDQFMNFSQDLNASFYLSISNTPVAPEISDLFVNPVTLKGGANSFGSVTITEPAPASGILILLRSGKPTFAQVPASVRIPAGATTAKFLIKTQPVQSETVLIVSASYKGVPRITNLFLTP